MNSIGSNCNELKKQYDTCFNNWFAENFLRGNTEDTACAAVFKLYQACVKKAMKDQNIEFKEITEIDYLTHEYSKEDSDNTNMNSNTKSSKFTFQVWKILHGFLISSP
ncbi:TP53-regulated inhibitor of apoptosis 1-like [Ctenocephalides felis]|uniref:TP53-regulated inhibitor of apoptosis 1-like n=1 Tax=Ctenocephalides felis TaxID=7515 RepID=UPI000E6E1F16|nr:TP53-regulated inhibitor of apoptosis 1-like [Ctenocephalides felis]